MLIMILFVCCGKLLAPHSTSSSASLEGFPSMLRAAQSHMLPRIIAVIFIRFPLNKSKINFSPARDALSVRNLFYCYNPPDSTFRFLPLDLSDLTGKIIPGRSVDLMWVIDRLPIQFVSNTDTNFIFKFS